jgi:hypothetical protein
MCLLLIAAAARVCASNGADSGLCRCQACIIGEATSAAESCLMLVRRKGIALRCHQSIDMYGWIAASDRNRTGECRVHRYFVSRGKSLFQGLPTNLLGKAAKDESQRCPSLN